MKWSLVVAALVAVPAVCHAQGTGTYFVTADKLAADCRASNRVADGPVPTTADLRDGDRCVSYVHGVIDGFESAKQWHWAPKGEAICLPKGFNGDQAIRMFVKYIDDHPEELNLAAPAVVWDAMHKSFPCS